MLVYNIDNNIVRAILTIKNIYSQGRWFNKKSYIGIAMCNPDDVFDEEKGKLIAKKRALKQFYKDQIKDLEALNKQLENRIRDNDSILTKHYKKVMEFENELFDITRDIKL